MPAPVFDDANPKAYYDAANPQGSVVVVAGTGTKIEVVRANSTGQLTCWSARSDS